MTPPPDHDDTARQPEHHAAAHEPDALRAAARELLARTVELPRSCQQLVPILREYRTALHAFAFQLPDAATSNAKPGAFEQPGRR